ncbi:MAG: nucleotidyltransferase family protein [Microthrixaceae bacterium]
MFTHDSSVDLQRLAQVCIEYGVVRLEVFGSVSRGSARPDSDIDIVYDLAPDTRLGWEIEDLADELAAVFGRPVDLVSRKGLHEQLRESVLKEARVLYAA